jgi:hydrogenase expression/formation protein HypD
VCDAEWREIGIIPESGYDLAEHAREFDARVRFDVELPDAYDPTGCVCGDIMLGKKTPTECPLFATRCVPREPVGPCMVSTEGACAAFYNYERKQD